MKIGKFKGLPQYSKDFIFDKLDMLKKEGNDQFPLGFKEKIETFKPIEVNILEYIESLGSNLAPHFDDFWIWGERIIGVNLLSDTVMRYTKKEDPSIEL